MSFFCVLYVVFQTLRHSRGWNFQTSLEAFLPCQPHAHISNIQSGIWQLINFQYGTPALEEKGVVETMEDSWKGIMWPRELGQGFTHSGSSFTHLPFTPLFILSNQWPGWLSPSAPQGMSLAPYRAVGCVCTAEVWTRAWAEVGIVALRFMDPFPAQVLPEVNVQRAHAAVLLQIATTRKHLQKMNLKGNHQCKKNFTNGPRICP